MKFRGFYREIDEDKGFATEQKHEIGVFESSSEGSAVLTATDVFRDKIAKEDPAAYVKTEDTSCVPDGYIYVRVVSVNSAKKYVIHVEEEM